MTKCLLKFSTHIPRCVARSITARDTALSHSSVLIQTKVSTNYVQTKPLGQLGAH